METRKGKNATIEELRYIVNNWDRFTMSELAEDMTKLFGVEVKRERIQTLAYKLKEKGFNLSKKKRERRGNTAYDLLLKEKTSKKSPYDLLLEENETVFYGKI